MARRCGKFNLKCSNERGEDIRFTGRALSNLVNGLISTANAEANSEINLPKSYNKSLRPNLRLVLTGQNHPHYQTFLRKSAVIEVNSLLINLIFSTDFIPSNFSTFSFPKNQKKRSEMFFPKYLINMKGIE